MGSFNLKSDISWHDFLVRAGLIIGTVAIITWALPRDTHSTYRIEKGKPWIHSDLKAPFDFPIYKGDEVVKAERDSLMRLYEPYFNYNKEAEVIQTRQFVKDYNKGIPGLPDDFISIIANRLHRIYAQGVMNNTDYAKYNKDTTQMIRIINGKVAVSAQINTIYSTVSAYEFLFAEPELSAHKEILQKCNLNDYISPNLVYDKERSEASLSDLQNSIPLASGIAQQGQKIIDRGEIVDAKTYSVLVSLQKELDRREKSKQQISVTILGQILYVTILVVCMTFFLTLFRKDYFEKPRSLAMLYSLIIVFTVVASMMVSHNIVTAFDPDLPASLSPAMLAALREVCGEDVVAMTDDLSMDAVSSRFSLARAAVLAVQAGEDMILCFDAQTGGPAPGAVCPLSRPAGIRRVRKERSRT